MTLFAYLEKIHHRFSLSPLSRLRMIWTCILGRRIYVTGEKCTVRLTGRTTLTNVAIILEDGQRIEVANGVLVPGASQMDRKATG